MYFNHAFQKLFLGTKGNQAEVNPGTPGGSAGLDQGFITTSGIPTVELAQSGPTSNYNLGAGTFGMFDKAWNSVAEADLQAGECCPLTLAAASLKLNDKQGPFHGGYHESNKSKEINPKYVQKFYRVDQCTPQQNVIHIGTTNYTSGLANPACCIQFFCDETYYLRVDIKGSPSLRFANHNLYRTFQADGGCCDGPLPVEVDSTLIFLQWAKQMIQDPYMSQFIKPIVFDENGNPFFATAADAVAAGWPANTTFDDYVSPGKTPGQCGGIRLVGAYVDTVFGNCSFQLTDHYEKEPIRILASLTDLTGDPCKFEGLCVIEECPALQGMGFGEQVVRDLILSESYLQNFFHSDIRIREITQGDQLLGSVNRGNLYTRYYIAHSVPRYNNPTGVYDNDRYLLNVVTNAPSASFESFMATWLSNCGDGCTSLEVHGCTPCVATPIPVPVN
jgi:hypothetical protein